jgi:hypothetical protein
VFTNDENDENDVDVDQENDESSLTEEMQLAYRQSQRTYWTAVDQFMMSKGAPTDYKRFYREMKRNLHQVVAERRFLEQLYFG